MSDEMMPGAENDLIAHVGELQAQLLAINAAVHALIATHPRPEALADDFLSRMDAFSDVIPPDRLAAASGHWRLLLDAMTTCAAARRPPPPQ